MMRAPDYRELIGPCSAVLLAGMSSAFWMAGSAVGSQRSVALASSVSENTPKRVAFARQQRELEAVALQIMIAPMLETRSGMFGTGSAGRHWQSMMSEQIARTLAKSGSVRLLGKGMQPGAGAPIGRAGGTRLSAPAAGCSHRPCASAAGWITEAVPARPNSDGRVSRSPLGD